MTFSARKVDAVVRKLSLGKSGVMQYNLDSRESSLEFPIRFLLSC